MSASSALVSRASLQAGALASLFSAAPSHGSSCSFLEHGSRPISQHFLCCNTCRIERVCGVCASSCHAGHALKALRDELICACCECPQASSCDSCPRVSAMVPDLPAFLRVPRHALPAAAVSRAAALQLLDGQGDQLSVAQQDRLVSRSWHKERTTHALARCEYVSAFLDLTSRMCIRLFACILLTFAGCLSHAGFAPSTNAPAAAGRRAAFSHYSGSLPFTAATVPYTVWLCTLGCLRQ